MTRLKELLRKTEFHIFLFSFFSLLFSWPLLTLIDNAQPQTVFLYFYLTWLALVAVLVLIARQCRIASKKGTLMDKPGL